MIACDRVQRKLSGTHVSFVLPLLNEAAVLERLADQIHAAMACLPSTYELLFVNDGSTDGSADILDRMARRDQRIRVVHLSRNFGHQAAVQAGLMHATGDAVVVMDTDLQDDPRAVPEFLRCWQEGYDVVYAVRRQRKEGLVKRALFYAFYRLLGTLAADPPPKDAGNFSLLDRRVADWVVRLPDFDRYFPGLRNWVGFRQLGISVPRQARHDRNARVTWRALVRLAKTAIFGFSHAPLSVFYLIALFSAVICSAMFGFTLYHKFVTGLAIPGWTSQVILASFFGALNALGISILGEYVVRIYDQVRGRPHFVVDRCVNLPGCKMGAAAARQTSRMVEHPWPEHDILEAVADLNQVTDKLRQEVRHRDRDASDMSLVDEQ